MVDLKEFKELVIKGVEDNFSKDGELTPVLFMVSQENGLGMMPIPAMNDQVKDVLTSMVIPAAIRKTNASMIATVNEVWMRTQSKDEPVNNSIPVRDHSDKIEGVMVTIETKINTEIVIWKIIRPKNAAPYLELDDKLGNSTQIGGRFANLLGQKPSKN